MTAIKCEGCGGTEVFAPELGKLKCEHCGRTDTIKNSTPATNLTISYTKEYAPIPRAEEERHFECGSCGSVIILEDCEAKQCPSCGDNRLTEKRQGVYIPDGLLPFTISKTQATESFKAWIKKRKFAPNNLKKLAKLGKISGMYVPAWSYDFNLSGSYNGEISYEVRVGKDKTVRKRRPVYGPIQESYSNILTTGNDQVSSSVLNDIAPFNNGNALSYTSEYLLGFSGLDTNINAQDAHNNMIDLTKNKLERDLRWELCKGSSRVEWLNVNVTPNNEQLKYLFLPIYATHYTYKKKKYHTYINGQTGSTTGKAPKSIWKILGSVLGIIAVVTGLVLILK